MNSQGKFQVDVAEESQCVTMRLIGPDGAIFMQRSFLGINEAEDARDRLVSAWGGPLEVLPTMVRKMPLPLPLPPSPPST